MSLSKRLEAVANLVPVVPTIADVGTDHGYLAVALIEKKIAQRVVAIDVNQGPLASAKRYIAQRGLSSVIDCRLGDGLSVTREGEIDCAILCGMGGELMQHIISVGPEWLSTYIVQPQSHRAELKGFLVDNGYGITQEVCLMEGRKYYDIWVAQRSSDTVYHDIPKDSILWEYGAILQKQSDTVWIAYIHHRIQQLEQVVKGLERQEGSNKAQDDVRQQIEELRSIIEGVVK